MALLTARHDEHTDRDQRSARSDRVGRVGATMSAAVIVGARYFCTVFHGHRFKAYGPARVVSLCVHSDAIAIVCGAARENHYVGAPEGPTTHLGRGARQRKAIDTSNAVT